MGKLQKLKTFKGEAKGNAYIEVEPDFCPRCRNSVDPVLRVAYLVTETILQVCYQCPSMKCHEFFIATFHKTGVRHKAGHHEWKLQHTAPTSFEQVTFAPEIEKISPNFVAIYNETLAAESKQLIHLVGMGFRKALEFLIKDYLIHKKPGETDNIRKSMLGTCIKKYVDDQRLKDCAQRAAWLGNDETHYERRWVDKDVTDLKMLVRLSVLWIESSLVTESYKQSMPQGGAPAAP